VKIKFVFFGTVLLIGNLVFALPAGNIQRFRQDVTATDRSLLDSIILALVEMGLEYDVAKNRAETLFGGDHSTAAMSLYNLKSAFPEMDYESMVKYLSKMAMHGRNVDLASYDTLISIIQSTNHGLLSDSESYEKLDRVARLNGSIKV
jgi:hypothetical protein